MESNSYPKMVYTIEDVNTKTGVINIRIDLENDSNYTYIDLNLLEIKCLGYTPPPSDYYIDTENGDVVSIKGPSFRVISTIDVYSNGKYRNIIQSEYDKYISILVRLILNGIMRRFTHSFVVVFLDY